MSGSTAAVQQLREKTHPPTDAILTILFWHKVRLLRMRPIAPAILATVGARTVAELGRIQTPFLLTLLIRARGTRKAPRPSSRRWPASATTTPATSPTTPPPPAAASTPAALLLLKISHLPARLLQLPLELLILHHHGISPFHRGRSGRNPPRQCRCSRRQRCWLSRSTHSPDGQRSRRRPCQT